MDAVPDLLVLLGAALAVTAGIGVNRLPDVFARMHAATKATVAGLVLIAAGAAVRIPNGSGGVSKLALVVALQFLTAPVAAHLVGRASYRAGLLRPDVDADELAGAESVDPPVPGADEAAGR